MEDKKAPPAKGKLLSLLAKYFSEHPGSVVSLEDLVDATGGRGATIQAYVNKLRNLLHTIEVVNTGQLWRYMPNTQPDTKPKEITVTNLGDNFRSGFQVITKSAAKRMLFEQIGTAKGGDLILEAETGNLYRATEI